MPPAQGIYSSWIRRAEAFVRQLNYLPGRWGISLSIGPPISEAEADQLHQTLPFGLPAALRRFYTQGTGKCSFRYTWEPDKKVLLQLQEVFPHQMSYYGGAEFIPCSELLDAHGIHTWWDGSPDDFKEAKAAALRMWRNTIPFIYIANGDCVALHINENAEQLPVVYLCHDDEEKPVRLLSPSLDKFLADWELLCYLGPEIWLLYVFLDDSGEGPLNVEQGKVRRWRDIILGKHLLDR